MKRTLSRNPSPPMKTARLFLTLSLLQLGLVLSPAGNFVYQHTAGFASFGDFDGNGQQDVLLIDKSTGLYRIGYTSPAGAVTFAEGRPSGMTDVSGAAVGKMNGIASTSLAVTAPGQNRFHVLTPVTTTYTEPKVQTSAVGIGTSLLGALDIPGAAPTAEDDVALVGVLNGANLVELKQFRVNSGAITLLNNEDVADGAVREGNPFLPASGAAQIFGYVQASGATDTFRAWTLTGGIPVVALTASALPQGTSWIAAGLEGTTTDVVFYKSGATTLTLRRVQPNGGGWIFAAAASFNAPSPVAEIVPINSPAGGRLLARSTSGALSIYGYTLAGGFSAPLPVNVTGAPGVLVGLLPLPGNAFHLLYAPAAGQSPTAIVPFSNSGAGWVQGTTIVLPVLNSLDIYANLFILSSPLFRTANPELLRTFRSNDWSTGISVPGVAPFGVTGQTADFVGSSQGIGASSAVSVGTLPTGAPATATNQLHAQFSLYTFESTLGALPDTVTLSPTPGAYDHAIQIKFSGLNGGSLVYYRTTPTAAFAAWSAGGAPWLISDTTLEYFVISATNAAPVQRATYTFTQTPARQDQDGDGLPDFVEIAKGLNPAGGSDSDGDGYSDLTEIENGSNPNLASSHPSLQPTPATAPLVIVRPQPRLVNGTADGTVEVGAAVHLCDPAGTILGSGTVGAGGTSKFTLRDLSPETGFALARTAPHFTVNPVVGGVLRGREMLAIVPSLPQESWSYGTTNGEEVINEVWSWGGSNFREGSEHFPLQGGVESVGPQFTDGTWGALQDDPTWGALPTGTRSATAWITEFQAATSTFARPYLEITITPESTLRALILEEIAFTYFGVILGGDPLQHFSLTADRAPDRAERTHDRDNSATLRTANPANFNDPRYRMLNVLRHIDQLNIATKARAERIAREIYAAHPPETSEGPLDALRNYVRTGVIPTAFRPHVSETDTQIATTWNQLQTLRNTPPTRPVQSLTLRRTTANGNNPWLLTNPADNSQFALITPSGLPFMTGFYNLPEVDDEVLVTFFSDTPTVGGFASIEPLAFTFQTIPWNFSDADTDNDLLSDAWELRHFGTLSNGGLDQRDGSSYSLLQEYFEGTVPTDPASSPGVAPMLMALTNLRMGYPSSPSQLCVCVNWPALYSSFVDIGFRDSSNLLGFTEVSGLSVEFLPGQFNLNVNPAAAPRRFFLPFARLHR